MLRPEVGMSAAQTGSKRRGGSPADYREAGRLAGLAGEPNRPVAPKYSREPWQRTAFREGWEVGAQQRLEAIGQEGGAK